MQIVFKDVHTAHCCQLHGCKYGRPDCTVKAHGGQEQMCETCHWEIYVEGEWETAHLLNEMFNKGEKYAYARYVRIIADATKYTEKLRG